jgi:hypothetical protein
MEVTISRVITEVLGWLGSAVDTIASNQLLLIPFGVAVVGSVVGVLMRVFSGGRA